MSADPGERRTPTYSELETVSDEGDAPAEIGVVLDPSATGDPRPSRDVARLWARMDAGDEVDRQLRWDTSAHWVSLVVLSVLIGGIGSMQVLEVVALAWLWWGR